MFWKSSKPSTKESTSTAIVRQDSRTTVKTTSAQSETTSTSVQNATVFNNNKGTVAYKTTTQTVTHQQQARVTEITKRYTPTLQELEELLAMANLNKTTTETSTSTSKPAAGGGFPGSRARARPSALPPIEFKSNCTSSNNNSSPLSPLTYSYDSPRPSSSTTTRTTTTTGGGGFRKPTTPTIAKVQTTVVTQKDGRSVTSRVEKQRVKVEGRAFNFATPSAAHTTRKLDAKPFQLSSPNSPLTTTTLRAGATSASTSAGGTYRSPYLNRSLYSAPTASTRAPALGATAAPPTSSTRLTSSTFAPALPAAPPPTATNASTKTSTKPFPSWLSFSSSSPSQSSSTSSPTAKATSSSRVFGSTPTALSASTGDKQKTTTTTPTTKTKAKKLKPGIAYIFNNEHFDNPNNEYRVGSSEDVKRLRETFEKFKLSVTVIENGTVDKIQSTVRKIETKDFSSHSCLVVVILSHGARHEEVCAKDGTYSIDDTIVFPVLRNRTLIEKPKLFFIQACKGSMEIGGLHKDAVQPHGRPDEILKCYSTFEGYVSYRTEEGSLFIKSMCSLLKLFGETKNVKDIMDMVILQVKQDTQNKQIPAITSTLTQPYVFGDYV